MTSKTPASSDSESPVIQTGDGSYTVRHPGLGETYHATQGAASEAEAKFILPSRLRDRLQEGPVRMLDIGFGLGINCRAALACDAPHGLHIDTIEWEAEALERGLQVAPGDPLISALQRDGQTRQVTLHLGDLRTVLPTLSPNYDVIFHDPFSPMKNSEAWTVEVFQLLKDLTSPGAILTTYSESRIIRSGLHVSGWCVGESEAVPPHRGGTIATHTPEELKRPLDPTDFLTEPYRDPELKAAGNEIRSQREELIRQKR